MCFAASVLEGFEWSWYTLAEDVEFHLALVRAGIRVDFVPETTVCADMPVSLAQAQSQNERWERGRLQLRRTVFGLIVDGLRLRSALQVDAAIEQLIPPLSVPFALAWACLLVSALLRLRIAVLLSMGALTGFLVHLLTGLIIVRAPLAAYRSLAYAPTYIAWKVLLYARSLVGGGSNPWIRRRRLG